jgi:hypothetical protein
MGPNLGFWRNLGFKSRSQTGCLSLAISRGFQGSPQPLKLWTHTSLTVNQRQQSRRGNMFFTLSAKRCQAPTQCPVQTHVWPQSSDGHHPPESLWHPSQCKLWNTVRIIRCRVMHTALPHQPKQQSSTWSMCGWAPQPQSSTASELSNRRKN